MADEKVSVEPQLQDRSVLAADRITLETRRIETDADGNVFVNVAGGSLTPSGTQDVNIVGQDLVLDVDVNNFPAVQTVDGTVDIGNFPSSQPVTGPLTDSELRATPVPVSGPLTDTQLRATPVPVSGTVGVSGTVAVSNFPATQPISGTVAVSNFPATQPVSGPLTDTQLRASPVPVSGPLTDTQLRATPVPVSNSNLDVLLSTRVAEATFTARINTQGQKTMAASTPVVLPSDQIVSTSKAQVTNAFSAVTSKTAIGLTELNSLFIKNPNASGKTAYIRRIIFSNIHTVDGSWIRLRAYSNPTTSADGAAVARNTLAIGSGNTAVVTAFNTPTSSANGNLLQDITVYSGQTVVFDCENRVSLLANNTLMLTVVADAAGRSATMSITWEEA